MSVCFCRDDVRRHLNHILLFIWVDFHNFGIRKKDAPLFTDGEHAYPNIASMPECGKWHQIIFTMRFLEKNYHQSKIILFTRIVQIKSPGKNYRDKRFDYENYFAFFS